MRRNILKRLLSIGQSGPKGSEPEVALDCEEPSDNASDNELSIQVDRPIRSVAEDIFDRASFAEQVAKTIARRRDPSSLVIGIYGPWGDGKTSTLAMVREYLEAHPDVLPMDYNPWFYGDSTEAITRSFFNSIRNKLEKSGWFSRENIGELMATYGKAIPQVGDALQSVGEAFTSEALVETRDKVGSILRKHGKKIVIFIDDIDRLDRRDIQTLFKLVRLSGDFDHTTYVLAFDDAIVAEALGEAYGTGDPLAGRRFLEKIVQVPLHLPPARPDKLRDLMFKACDRVIAENRITLDDADGPELGQALMQGLGHALRTPRRVKLFDNAISFAVPILKGEVRLIDQIQIEALRVFYPSIYDAVRSNPDEVLSARERHNGQREPQPTAVERAIENLSGDVSERKAINDLLRGLFPRLSGTIYGDDWDSAWAREKRICSKDYFRRYFTYAIPTGDLPDRMIDTLLEKALAEDEAGVGEVLDDAYQRNAAELLIRKLRGHEETLDILAAPALGMALVKRATKIPIGPDLMFGTFVFTQAAIVICQLAQRMDPAGQDAFIASAVEQTDSLHFAIELLRWSEARTTKGTERGFLTPERIQPIAAILARRFFAAANLTNIVESADGQLGRMAFGIVHHGDEATKQSLFDRLSGFLEADPAHSLVLLKALAGRSQGGDGITRPAEFGSDSYRSIAKFFEPARIYAQLIAVYGPDLETSTWEDNWGSDYDVDRRIADQFSDVHRRELAGPAEEGGEQPG